MLNLVTLTGPLRESRMWMNGPSLVVSSDFVLGVALILAVAIAVVIGLVWRLKDA
jgi:hypothetical protein